MPSWQYEFTPEAETGAVLGEGASLGAVAVPGGIGYRVLVPPGLSAAWWRRYARPGPYPPTR